MRINYLIVGAGLFGAVLAERLHRMKKSVIVIDKREHIGGNCYTEKIEGIDCHNYGAHIFHTNDLQVWEYINRFGAFNNYVHQCYARVNSNIYDFPINLHTISQVYGRFMRPADARKILTSKIARPKNLKEKAISMMGEQLYKMFIEGYTWKQWKKNPALLSPDIISRIPMRFTFNKNYFHNCRYQGIPCSGYTDLIRNMLDGVLVELGSDFFKSKIKYRHLIYTGAIDELFGYKYGKLEYRSIENRRLVLNEPDWQGTAVINYPEREIPHTRIIEHKHFCPGLETKKTVISYEYPNGDDRYYPVLTTQNIELYKKYKRAVRGMIVGGRLGDFAYYDMDVTIRKALDFKL